MSSIDYRKFSYNGKKLDGMPDDLDLTPSDKRWWLLEGEEAANAIAKTLHQIQQAQARRNNQYQVSTRLYGNLDLMGVTGFTASRLASNQAGRRDKITYNVVQSAIDTVTSKIAKNKPSPYFLTSGGDYKVQRRAKKLDQFVEGLFYECDAYELGTQIFRDACVFGTGVVRVFEHEERVKFERVIPSEIYVDEVEAFYGEPRQLHRVKNLDRQVLAELFPEHREAIEEANEARPDEIGAYQHVSDQVAVCESWHLPSAKAAKDGKHFISINGVMLLEEEWDKPYFPFAFFHWSKQLYGFWGQGLAEQIQNIQLEINKTLWVMQRSYHLAGSFKVLVENGSKIVKEHLNNDIGAIVTYTGTKPEYVVPPVIPAGTAERLAQLKADAYEQAGVSQLSASSKKPDGLNSGKALREYNDIESDRFMTVGQAYERFFLDLARLGIACAKDIHSRKRKFDVSVPGKKFLQTISWKEINLEEDEYVMQVFPVSSLPNDPSGRLQTIQEYMQAGFLTPRQGRRLLDFPDLQQVEDLANASEDYLHQVMEKIVDSGEYTPPEPYDDLALARELALQYYQQGKSQNLEEERLELLRRFMSQIDALQAAAQPPQAPQPPPQGGQPMARPAPQPQSDLIPNVPAAA